MTQYVGSRWGLVRVRLDEEEAVAKTDDVAHYVGAIRNSLGKLFLTNFRLIYVPMNFLWQIFDGRFTVAFAEMTELGAVDDRLRGRPFVGDMWQPFYVGVGSTRHWFGVRGSYGPADQRAKQESWLQALAVKTKLEPAHEVKR